jgi:hypothetical protein
MTLSGLFNTLGDIFQWTFNFLQNDFWLTWLMNNGVIVLGFIGLFYWLNWQRKFNAQAENNPDQLK